MPRRCELTRALRPLSLWLVLVAGSSLEASASGPRAPDDGGFPQALANSLQAAVDQWAESPTHRGVSAAVLLKSGQEWIGVAGVEADGKALGPEHLIWIASITKTMTGAVIMSLAEEELLDLEDPVGKWLGELPNIDPEITIRQLLNHTNGLANYTKNPDLQAAIDADGAHVFTSDELVALVGPASFARGERTQYTNTAFVLLGMIGAKAGGRPITELWTERLWAPLGLEQIFLPGYQEPPGPVAMSWYGPRSDAEVAPLEHMALLTMGNGAFGLFSNADTVARWAHELFNGGAFGEAMGSEMLQFVPAAGNIRGESGAGLGIRKYDYLGREQWGHSGGSPLGTSLVIHDEQTGITVAVLMNQGSNADHFTLAPRLLEIAQGD